MKVPIVLFTCFILACCAKAKSATPEFFAALRTVETGSEPNGGRDSVGDNGASVGPLQIQRACWLDSRIAGRYEDCRDYDYACRVALAYFNRYCPQAVKDHDYETMARIWNGGPRGHKKSATLGYWRKVQQAMR